MILRISIPSKQNEMIQAITDYIATEPDPTYGLQLQDFGIVGHAAEYRLDIQYEEIEMELTDGETVSLRRPTYRAADLGYGELHPNAMFSPRIAPQMIGLGLLEAIPAADILANVDENDATRDGISGRANIVWSPEFEQPMLGRFGLKAGAPTIRQQSADAFLGDLGISTSLHQTGWGECTAAQDACRAAIDGGDKAHGGLEVDNDGLELVTVYSRNLAVPARRDFVDPEVLLCKEVFYTTGCAACHTPKFVTARLKDRPEQSFQLIWPYSGLLLHDMGDGLADHRPEARATGTEWRTPPLWGIGLTQQASGHTYFLHDGRARSLLEAILWHGREARRHRDAVIAMLKENRDAHIRFLKSL